MPLPLLALGALVAGAAQSAPKILGAINQKDQANKLRLVDTTTAAEREQLAMSRQAASTSRLPGQGYQEARLGAVQAGAMQNARLGASSPSDFLAAAGAADARRQQGEMQLGIQGLNYQNQMKGQLRQDLGTQSKRQQHDLDTYNQTKGALIQASNQNLNDGINTAVGYGTEALLISDAQKNGNKGGGSGGAGGYDPYGNTRYDEPMGGRPLDAFGRRSRRYNMGSSNYYGQ